MEAVEWKKSYFEFLSKDPQRLVAAVEQTKVSPDPLEEKYLKWCELFVQALGTDKHRTALNAVRQLVANSVSLSYVVRHVYDIVAWERFVEKKHDLMRTSIMARDKSKGRLDTIEGKLEELREAISHEINLAIYDLPPMAEEHKRVKSDLVGLAEGAVLALQEIYDFEKTRVRVDGDKKMIGIMLALRLNFVISALPHNGRDRWWPELAAIMTVAAETMRGKDEHSMHYSKDRLKVMASDITQKDMDQLIGTVKAVQPDFFTNAASRPVQGTLDEIKKALAFQPTHESDQVIQQARALRKRHGSS
jgi:hypothetical protein